MGVCTSKSTDLEVVEAKQSEKSAATYGDSRPNIGNGFVLFNLLLTAKISRCKTGLQTSSFVIFSA